MTNKILTITGRPKRFGRLDRYEIRIMDTHIYLTGKSFSYLVKLANALKSGTGWIHKHDLAHDGLQSRYIYNLKCEMGSPRDYDAPIPSPFILNDRDGNYKLNFTPGQVAFEPEYLLSFPDWEINQIAMEVSNGK